MLNAQGAVVAVTGFLLLGGATSVLAAGNGEFREQTVLQGSKLTLCQAIATAEQYTGGKAYDAGTDVDHGKSHVVVETNGPKGVQTVMIDVGTGQTVGSHGGGEAD